MCSNRNDWIDAPEVARDRLRRETSTTICPHGDIRASVMTHKVWHALLAAGVTLALSGAPSIASAQALSEASAAPAPTPTPSASADHLTPQEEAKESSIREAQNPVGSISIVPFQENANFGVGPHTRYQNLFYVQPAIPIMLSPNLNLISRTFIPVVSQPSFAPPAVCASPTGCPSTVGLSDIQEQLFFAPKTKTNGLIWGAGPMFEFPTASPGMLGSGQWSAGPTAVALIMPGAWTIGLLASQRWSFAGKTSTTPVNYGAFQPFITYNLPGDTFSFSTVPIVTANYSAPGDQKWTVPLGGGGTYSFSIGEQLMQFSVFYYTNVIHPVTAPQTSLQFSVDLLFPVTRGQAVVPVTGDYAKPATPP